MLHPKYLCSHPYRLLSALFKEAFFFAVGNNQCKHVYLVKVLRLREWVFSLKPDIFIKFPPILGLREHQVRASGKNVRVRGCRKLCEMSAGHRLAIAFMNSYGYLHKACIIPSQPKFRNRWEVFSALTAWWGLMSPREGHSFFFEGVATSRFLTPWWVVPHPCTHRKQESD